MFYFIVTVFQSSQRQWSQWTLLEILVQTIIDIFHKYSKLNLISIFRLWSLECFRRTAHWGGSHMAHQSRRQEQWWLPRFPGVTKSFNWQINVEHILMNLQSADCRLTWFRSSVSIEHNPNIKTNNYINIKNVHM